MHASAVGTFGTTGTRADSLYSGMPGRSRGSQRTHPDTYLSLSAPSTRQCSGRCTLPMSLWGHPVGIVN